MAAKSNKQHGFRITASLFVPYDPAVPASITDASTKANALKTDLEKLGVTVVNITPPTAGTI